MAPHVLLLTLFPVIVTAFTAFTTATATQRLSPARPTVLLKASAEGTAIDPKKAIAELGELTQQIQLVWTEGSTWTPEKRMERRRDIVERYVRVFAPAVAFSGVQLLLTFGLLGFVLLVLTVSGRGYADVAGLLAGVPLLGDAVAKVDPSWGNIAVALAIVEVTAPVLLLPLSLIATPAATQALQTQLTELGLDADGLNKRIEEVLERTTD